MPINRHMSQFSRRSACPFQNLPIDYDASPNTGADCHVDDIVASAPGTKHILAQTCRVSIVFNEDRYMKMLGENIAQRNPLPARQIWWSVNNACLAVQWTRSGDTNACYLLNATAFLVTNI